MRIEALLLWFRESARELPWRRDPTPYAVLLSELMCQQTRVETALPYFERFLTRWPTIEALAAESESAVVEAWAGLGYYSRARNLHRCAVLAVERGGLPEGVSELRALPGIGPYTAGAIASIAFGESAIAVDGNVQRVLARFHRIAHDPAQGAGRREVEARARDLHAALPSGAHPGDLNQALMELGAKVCTPRGPRCADCPVQHGCAAKAAGCASEFPIKKKRKPPVAVTGVAGLLRSVQGILCVRTPSDELLGGLWTPPLAIAPLQGRGATLEEAFATAGWLVERTHEIGTVTHIFSHRLLTVRVFAVRAAGRCPATDRWDEVEWTTGSSGMSTLARKILAVDLALPLLAAEPPAP